MVTADAAALEGRKGPLAVLGWAAYLACSWTWCIGMFLPVLLIRDFGLWGFVVFAVPNVVGAAAMGWVLTRGGAEAIRREHGVAVRAFSVVTVAFQVFFFAWLLSTWPMPGALVGLLPLTILPVVLIPGPGLAPRRAVAAAILLVSGIVLYGGFWPDKPLDLGQPLLPPRHVPALAAVCVLGFGLCPYLDATFLRARSALGVRPSRAAFTIGFGLLFAAMIVGTVLYTPAMLAWLSHGPGVGSGTTLGVLVAAHFAPQLFFTAQAHTRESAEPRRMFSPWWLWVPSALIAAGALMLFGLEPAGARASGEFIYRLFMSFYGLVFPAYVWVCMIPRRGRSISAPTRGSLVVCGIASVLASPCYWLGFIERQTWWLVPGVAIVLLARLCVPRGELGGRGGAAPYTQA